MVSTMLVWLTDHSFWFGLGIRLGLAWLLPLLLDEGTLLPGVAYTDIDYHVFMDGAAYIQQGQSPYQRTTYRYTPFLAQGLAWLSEISSREAPRHLFCVADALCGLMIAQYRKQQRQRQQQEQEQESTNSSNKRKPPILSESLQDALWWMYNPLAINICTRGSAESLMVLFPVLVTIWLIQWRHDTIRSSSNSNNNNKYMQQLSCFGLALVAGVWHGIAVHAKLYPIIYSLSYVISLAQTTKTANPISPPSPQQQEQSMMTRRLSRFVHQWVKPLLGVAPLTFAVASASTFVGVTALGVHWYGWQSLDDGLLYHFSRVDHRHNYSMHWYWIYLARAEARGLTTVESSTVWIQSFLPWVGRLLFVPQVILLLYSSFALAPMDLTVALFVQAFLFVAHNKVITGQYFTWYLCLLPLCSHWFVWTRGVVRGVLLLLVSMVCWLGSAYLLEMQGWAVHRMVWSASVGFFVAQIHLIVQLLQSVQLQRQRRRRTNRNSTPQTAIKKRV